MSVVMLILSPALASAHNNLGYNVATVKQENSGHHIAKREPATLKTLGTFFTTLTGLLTTIIAPFIPKKTFLLGNQSHVTFAQLFVFLPPSQLHLATEPEHNFPISASNLWVPPQLVDVIFESSKTMTFQLQLLGDHLHVSICTCICTCQ